MSNIICQCATITPPYFFYLYLLIPQQLQHQSKLKIAHEKLAADTEVVNIIPPTFIKY